MMQSFFFFRRAWRSTPMLLVLLALTIGVSGGLALPPAHAQQPGRSLVYYIQTGHFLGGAFRSYFERNGNVERFGYPVTEEFFRSSDGKIVQYFERARFELDVIDGRPIITLGDIGTDYMQARGLFFPPIAPLNDTATQRFFPETGHSIQGQFKAFWDANEGATYFGAPLSEQTPELLSDGQFRTVQYFERARLELHGTAVRAGLIGRDVAPCQHLPPRPQSLPPSGPLPEGDSSTCDDPIVALGRVYPDISTPGTVLGFEGRNYQPGELVSLWLNIPGGKVRGLGYKAIADENGNVLIGFQTREDDPLGVWSLVGAGVESGREAVAPFLVQR